MSKLIARYFYSPICPESFVTLKRLKKLFQNNGKFIFEIFNTTKNNLNSSFPFFPEEKKIFKTLTGKSSKPLFFGKLFIEGEEIKGFPPSAKCIKEVFSKYDLPFNSNLYPFEYKSVKREKWKCKHNDFTFQSYARNLSLDIPRVCTEYHPFLEEKNYNKNEWIEHEKQKLYFLENKLKEDRLVGIVAYYKENPVAFIEAFSLDLVPNLGFPVSEINDKGLMITCLSVRTEVSGYGVGTRLIIKLEKEAINNNYKTLEVISFPDEHNWHPESFYKKLGYKEIKKINELKILKKSLE